MRWTLAHSVLATALLVVASRPVAAAPNCVGDCSEGGGVTVNDLLSMVNVALGSLAVSACDAGNVDNDGTIGVTEIVTGVNTALNECGAAPTPTQTPGGIVSYAGDYHGTAGIYSVRFHVAADGSADGFLDLPSAAAVVTRDGGAADVPYAASGQTNLSTGTYQLAGSFFDQPFSFTGQLPAGPDTTGTLHVTVFGSTSDGSLFAGTSGPSPTATPTPGCDSANLQMTFSNVSANFNGTASSFAVTRMIVASEAKAPDYIADLHEVYDSTFNGTDCTQPRNIQILLFEAPGGLATGQTFPISLSGGSDPGALVYYGQEAAGGDSVWSASAGTVFIDGVSGSVVTLRVVGAAMTETAAHAAGSFTLDVSGQVNNFTRQP